MLRRGFTIASFGISSIALPRLGRSQPSEVTVRIRFDDQVRVVFPSDQIQLLQILPDTSRDAADLSAHVPPNKGAPVILIALGIVAIPVLWQAILEMRRQTYYGGIVIDARQTPPLISHGLNIPPELILFIHPNGTTERFTPNEFSRNTLDHITSRFAR